MRKYIRKIIRHEAEQEKAKPSKYVHYEFEKMQIKKYGFKKRLINKAKGTRRRINWKANIQAELDAVK